MRAVVLVIGLLLLPPGAAGSQPRDPSQSVFLLQTVERTRDGQFQGVEYGTGFFVARDGTAVTNSHVVYRARQDPHHFAILAVVGREFYSAQILCATPLAYDPLKTRTLEESRHTRDIAEIKLEPSTLPFTRYVYHFTTGEDFTIATAHRGPVPPFPPLTYGARPIIGAHVQIIGFGAPYAVPDQWTAPGQIDRFARLIDGTDVFEIEFPDPPRPGSSGSPILNDQDQVVGVYTWGSSTLARRGWAQGLGVLDGSCPSPPQPRPG